ncbi:TIR domain-containing protein [Aeromonas veronii]|nr:TIR domain-containing protein [Aeromonas veronii]
MAVKVFISYAHESIELANNVLEFSNLLRSKGIDSEIDQYEEAPAEGWPKWMMRQVQQADFVLICCSKLFYERANDFSGKDDGLGVKWETSLILQQLYGMSTSNIKFIPIIFEGKDKKYIPLPLQPYTYYQLDGDSNKQRLIDRLRGVSNSKRPPLGEEAPIEEKFEELDPKERKSMFLSSIIDVDLWNEAKWSGMAFVSDPSLRKPPIACFMFANEETGEKIFRNLRKDFGNTDAKEEIRLSFIEGISTKAPRDYKVHFGSSIDVLVDKLDDYGMGKNSSLLATISRIQEMNPPSDPSSLTIFKHSYGHFKTFFITNAVTKNGQLQPSFSNLIQKNRVYFRTKNEVIKDKNDEDYVVFGKVGKI